MIHLTEAIVGINKRPQRIGNDKLFSELKLGGTVYWYWKAKEDERGEFTVKAVEPYTGNSRTKGNGKHKMKTGAGKGYSYASYEYKITFGDDLTVYVPGNVAYMELSNDNDPFNKPIMMVTTSEKEYEKFKKIYKIR